jgi:hypothetical protein
MTLKLNPTEDEKVVEKRIKDRQIQLRELEALFTEASAYKNLAAGRRENLRLSALSGIFDGSKTLFIHADYGKEIIEAVSFAKRLGVQKVAVIGARDAIMHDAGLTVAINSDDAEMSRRLNQEAAKTVKYGGLSEEEALKLVTINPAKMLHIDNKMGSIKEGKDADVVLWSAHPLSVYAHAERTFVDGRQLFDIESDKVLRQDMERERLRIVQKMLSAKKGGAPTQTATVKATGHFHCDTEGEEKELDK